MERIYEYLNNSSYYYMIEEPALMEQFIQELDEEKTLELATTLNQVLRGKTASEDVIADDMIAGNLTAPTADIRGTIISNLLSTLRELDDNQLRAQLVYYTVINLHMFSDGNGRTARLLYGLLTNDIESEEWYIHDDKSMHKYDGDFCSYKNIPEESALNESASTRLSSIVSSLCVKHPSLKGKTKFQTYFGGMHGTSVPFKKIMPPDVLESLQPTELAKINMILGDNGNDYSIAGLTMLIMAEQKGQLEEWLRRDNENVEQLIASDNGEEWMWMRSRLSFNFKKNPDLLQEWDAEDWRKVITIGNDVKLMHFEAINDIYIAQQHQLRQNVSYSIAHVSDTK